MFIIFFIDIYFWVFLFLISMLINLYFLFVGIFNGFDLLRYCSYILIIIIEFRIIKRYFKEFFSF